MTEKNTKDTLENSEEEGGVVMELCAGYLVANFIIAMVGGTLAAFSHDRVYSASHMEGTEDASVGKIAARGAVRAVIATHREAGHFVAAMPGAVWDEASSLLAPTNE